jgi:hypothetical protein
MPNLARDSRGFSKDWTPTGDSTGLQPYLDLPPSKRRATDRTPEHGPDSWGRIGWWIVGGVGAYLVLIAWAVSS